MIVGTGVDIVDVARIRGIIERTGERFLRRVFTDREIEYCRRCAHPAERFATRFAAKEAVLKALGVGWQRGTAFRDIEVCVNELGAPGVVLSGRTLEISREVGAERIFISLSHDRSYAVAQAVAEAESDGVMPLEELEKRAILDAVRKHPGNISQAARKLGFSRATMYRKLNKYGVR